MVMYPTYGRNLKWNLEHIVIKKARKKVPAPRSHQENVEAPVLPDGFGNTATRQLLFSNNMTWWGSHRQWGARQIPVSELLAYGQL
jgi:hypothetical protein